MHPLAETRCKTLPGKITLQSMMTPQAHAQTDFELKQEATLLFIGGPRPSPAAHAFR